MFLGDVRLIVVDGLIPRTHAAGPELFLSVFIIKDRFLKVLLPACVVPQNFS
jgi:hypothetical protein